LSSIFIFGQDLLLFFTINPAIGNFAFTPDFLAEKIQLYKFMFVPQAWTLSLEMVFYLFAPLLVKARNSVLFTIIIASLTARVLTYKYGFISDAWQYRFFPFEIMFFLLGIVSYRIYTNYKQINIPKTAKIIVPVFLLAYIVLFQYIPVNFAIKQWILYVVMVFAIPFLFLLTKHAKIDRELGELSYPVYISHVLIINIMSLFFTGEHPKYFCLLAIIFSIGFSYLLIKLIVNPIEKLRQARVSSNI